MDWRIWTLLAAVSAVPTVTQASDGIALVESQPAYLARCRNETIARYPDARAQAGSICQANWTQIVAAGRMAEAILTAAPAPAAGFAPAAARTALPSVQWAARPRQGSVASGRLGDIDVVVTRTPAPGMTLRWFKQGEPIPFNLQDALRVRGASATMIACLSFGSSEDSRVYRVTKSGKAPFALTITRREAALASQSSDFMAAADFSGRMPSLAGLRRDGGEWQAACPQ